MADDGVTAQDGAYPALLPLEQLLVSTPPRATQAQIGAITARAEGLEGRARGLGSRPAGSTEAARLARLRQRAEALRAIR